MRVALLILVLAGCDQLFNLQHLRDGGIDAPSDASGACVGRSPQPMFCGDFDAPTLMFYVDGTARQVDVTGNLITVTPRAPSTTGSNGLWYESAGGTLVDTFADQGAPVVRLDATFALNISKLSTTVVGGDAGLFILSLGSCYVELVLAEAQRTLRIHGVCGTTPLPVEWLTSLPLDWFHVHFTFDISGEVIATIGIEGGSSVQLPYMTTTTTPAAPSIGFGVDGTGHDGLIVGIDDIAVTGS